MSNWNAPFRDKVLAALADGPLNTRQLAERVGYPTLGFVTRLNGIRAAGLIVGEPGRGNCGKVKNVRVLIWRRAAEGTRTGGDDMTDANQTPAEPGTPLAIIGALFDFAEAECGRNPVAARHALTTVKDWVANAKAEIAKLRAALKPFADYSAVLAENRHPDDMMVGYYFPPRLTVGDCRRAAELLAGKGEG